MRIRSRSLFVATVSSFLVALGMIVSPASAVTLEPRPDMPRYKCDIIYGPQGHTVSGCWIV